MNPFSVKAQSKSKSAVLRPPTSDLVPGAESKPVTCVQPRKCKSEKPEEGKIKINTSMIIKNYSFILLADIVATVLVPEPLDFDGVDFDEPMDVSDERRDEAEVKVEPESAVEPKVEPQPPDEVLT